MTQHAQARRLLESARAGSLGTLGENGFPFVSLVTVASTSPTSLVMLLSGLARHTRNLGRDSNCSLLLVEPGGESGNPLAGVRLTITGVAKQIPDDQVAEARRRFLAAHPSSAAYVDFDDFTFFQIDIQEAHLVAGFGRIETIPADRL